MESSEPPMEHKKQHDNYNDHLTHSERLNLDCMRTIVMVTTTGRLKAAVFVVLKLEW